MATLTPGHGFVSAIAGARGNGLDVVAFGRGEAGVRFVAGSTFAFGEASLRPGGVPEWMAGLGLKAEW